jgi:uncharacterized protein (DUF4415 family)
MPKLKKGTVIPTDSEDRIITRQAAEDNTLLSDKQLDAMKPVTDNPVLKAQVKRGRPPKDKTKKSTTIRLNGEILDFFKGRGKGWQTEINDILQKYVNSHHAP